ncbi:uncharacterized protein LTR77_001109 [Saxophila tyrrhenica]|uniref:Uncharacterized protein n=1 Tax=Saxophila tyrrhenica TaxID=1690608 RepID=A0AAV9PKI4_9PEZI|nr:hypothetical protein LTR77_001109 [Saxophila tyrrhenica]
MAHDSFESVVRSGDTTPPLTEPDAIVTQPAAVCSVQSLDNADTSSAGSSYTPRPYLTEVLPIGLVDSIIAFTVDVAAPCRPCKHECTQPDYHKSGICHLLNLAKTCSKLRIRAQKLLHQHLRIRSFPMEDGCYTFTHETENLKTDYVLPEKQVFDMVQKNSRLVTHTAINVRSLTFDFPRRLDKSLPSRAFATAFVQLISRLPQLKTLLFNLPLYSWAQDTFREAFENHFNDTEPLSKLPVTEAQLGIFCGFGAHYCPGLMAVVGYDHYNDFRTNTRLPETLLAISQGGEASPQPAKFPLEHFEMACFWTQTTWNVVEALSQHVILKKLGVRGQLAEPPLPLDYRSGTRVKRNDFYKNLRQFKHLETLILSGNVLWNFFWKYRGTDYFELGLDPFTSVTDVVYEDELQPHHLRSFLDFRHDHFGTGELDATNRLYDKVYREFMTTLHSEGLEHIRTVWIEASLRPRQADGKLRPPDVPYYDYSKFRDVKLVRQKDGSITISRQDVRRQLTDGLVPVVGFPHRTYPDQSLGSYLKTALPLGYPRSSVVRETELPNGRNRSYPDGELAIGDEWL